MKNKITCFVLILNTCQTLFAQTPNWLVNENQHVHFLKKSS